MLRQVRDYDISTICDNKTVASVYQTTLEGLNFENLLKCSADKFSDFFPYMSFVSFANVRNLLCGDLIQNIDGSEAYETFEELPLLVSTLCLFISFIAGAGYFISLALQKKSLKRYRNTICAWWTLIFMCSAYISKSRDRIVDPDNFYIHDNVTKCAFETENLVPTSIFKDFTLSIMSPAHSIYSVYHKVMKPLSTSIRFLIYAETVM
jgi:hypothetical protein